MVTVVEAVPIGRCRCHAAIRTSFIHCRLHCFQKLQFDMLDSDSNQSTLGPTRAEYVRCSSSGSSIRLRLRYMLQVVRVLAHTQVKLIKGIGQKKAHLMEVQINGGSVADKVDFAVKYFEKKVGVDAVFSKDEQVDIIGVTRGHGYEGVVHR
jgi:ribosomal protein L3